MAEVHRGKLIEKIKGEEYNPNPGYEDVDARRLYVAWRMAVRSLIQDVQFRLEQSQGAPVRVLVADPPNTLKRVVEITRIGDVNKEFELIPYQDANGGAGFLDPHCFVDFAP